VGCEYTSMFRNLDCKVNLVNTRSKLLEFLDDEIIDALAYHLRDRGVLIRHGETYEKVEGRDDGVVLYLKSGKQLKTDILLWANGRDGNSDNLGLDKLGIEPDTRGLIKVNENFQTSQPHIYAVGDVIGFPALAATSMDQGRLAAYHAFEEQCDGMTALQPIGIYSIPEVSYVGVTEVELTKNSVPYEVGVSRYRELARGQIAGDSYGMLKLLVSTEDRKLLGVHIFGTSATELVHIGQAVMGCGGTVDYLVDAVFNYPTFSEAYKVAALDVTNKMRALSQFRH
jgi:NAD(P) transhydrogenase